MSQEGQAKHPVRVKEEGETWALGSQLQPDEQRYVMERFPESRRTLGLTETEWLSQMSFRLNRSGTLDLRAITCRLPLVPGEAPRFHRVPRGKEWPTPASPKRQQRQSEPPQLPAGVRPIVEEALASGDLTTANERLHQLSGGKTIQQVADDWAGQIQTPAEPEQREQQQPHQPDLQLPLAGPRPSRPAEERTYTQRVWTAYRALADEMQAPDVPIHALHRRVGGSLLEIQEFLRAESLAHRAVASIGEPAFAGDAARQSALCLPGEIDRATGKPQSFLLIKLIEPSPMTQEQPLQPTAALAPSLGGRLLTRDDLDVIIEALEYRCDAISGGTDFDEVTRLKSIGTTLEKLRALEAQPQRPEHERYEGLLRATAALKYPEPERTPELQERIEATIQRKVSTFVEERLAKEHQHQQQQQDLTRQPDPARQKSQGRGIER